MFEDLEAILTSLSSAIFAGYQLLTIIGTVQTVHMIYALAAVKISGKYL